MAKVFISYSRKDIEFAKRLTGELQKSELDFWIDWEGIPPTVDWWKEIERGIEEADAFLFIISPDAAKSKVCGQEIDTAVKNGKRIIPIVAREIEWEDTPPQLGHLNYIFFSRNDDFDTAVKKLVTAIHTDYEWVTTQRRLQIKALEWERRNKENSFLLRGRDLQDAEQQLAMNTSKEPHPTDLQRGYVFQSRKASDKQKRIITGITVAGVIALASLAVYGILQAIKANSNAINALNQASIAQAANTKSAYSEQQAIQAQATTAYTLQLTEDELRKARNQALSAQSELIGNEAPSASILLALEAIKLNQNNNEPVSHEAYQALRNSLTNSQGVAVEGNYGEILAMEYSKDGKWFATGGTDGIVRIWDVAQSTITNPPKFKLNCDQGEVDRLVFSNNGSRLVTTGSENTICIWDMDAIELNQSARKVTPNLESMDDIDISWDGQWVVTGNSKNENVTLWNIDSGGEYTKTVKSFLLPITDRNVSPYLQVKPFKFSFNPDGTSLAIGNNFAMEFWLLTSSGPVQTFWMELKYSAPKSDYDYNFSDIAYIQVDDIFYSDDGKYIFGFGHDQLSADDAPFKVNAITYEIFFLPHVTWQSIEKIKISSDQHWLAASNSNNIWLWDLKYERDTAIQLDGHQGTIGDIAFSPDGTALISVSPKDGLGDGTVRLWNLAGRDPSIIPHTFPASSRTPLIAINADASWLAISNENQLVRLFNLRTMDFSVDPVEFSVSTLTNSSHGKNQPLLKSSTMDWLIPNETSDFYKYIFISYSLPKSMLHNLMYLPTAIQKEFQTTTRIFGYRPDGKYLVYEVCDSSGFSCKIFEKNMASDQSEEPTLLFAAEKNFYIENIVFASNNQQALLYGYFYVVDSQIGMISDSSRVNSNRLYILDLNKTSNFGQQNAFDWVEVPTPVELLDPNNKYLFINQMNGMYILNMKSKDLIADKLFYPGILAVTASSDGRWVANVNQTSGDLKLLDLTKPNTPTDSVVLISALIPQDESANPMTRTGRGWFRIENATFSPDNHWLMMLLSNPSGDANFYIWDVIHTDPIREPIVIPLDGIPLLGKARGDYYIKNENWLGIIDSSGKLTLINLSGDTPIVKVLQSGGTTSVFTTAAFSPDNHWFIAADKSGYISLYNLSGDLDAPTPINPALHSLASLAFSPDNTMIAGGTSDGKVLIWNTSAVIAGPDVLPIVLSGGVKAYDQIAFTPDNNWVIALGQEETPKAWRTNFDEILNFACTSAGRNLSQTEWKKYGFTENYQATCHQFPIE